MKAQVPSTGYAALSAKRAKLKEKVKRLVNIDKAQEAFLSAVPTSLSRLKRERRLHNPPKQQSRISAIQHLSVRQTVPLQSECDGSPDHFALQMATMVVAILLSLVLIAGIMFLPLRILALQGIPLFLVMVIAMYLWLQRVQRLESVLEESR